jgi:lysophospholipase L1-like esterase
MRTRKILFLASIFLLAEAGWAKAKIVDINLAESGAVLSGYWPQATVGGRVYIGGSNGSQLDATVTGKLVELTCFSNGATNITVTVDGKSYVPTFFKVNEWTTLTVDLGSSGTHALTIKQPFLGSGFYLDTGIGVVHGPTFSIRGNAPGIKAPASGFGQQYQLSDKTNVTPFIQFEGGLSEGALGGYPSVYYSVDFADQGFYFSASATGAVKGWIYGSGSLLTMYQDGVNVGNVTVPVSHTYQWVTLFNGDGFMHRYGVVASSPQTGFLAWSLMTEGGSLSPVPTIPRPRFLIFGDSIALGLLGTDYDSSEAIGQRLGSALGWAVYNRGISDTTVHEFPSGEINTTTEAGEARTGDITEVSAGARGMVIIYGVNDMYQVGGPETTAVFQSSYQNMLAQITAGVPASCQILCLGILPRVLFSPDTIATWNAAMQAAITAVGAPNVQYVEPSGWGLLQDNGPTVNYTDPEHNTADGIHPNEQGYSVILANITPYFAPAGAPTVTSAMTGTTQIGEPIAYQISATNSPMSFAADNLPAGLTLNMNSGLISGTPTVSGTFKLGLSVGNASGIGSEFLDLTVQRPVVTISVLVSEVADNGGEYGEFALQLSSARTSDLRINYSIDGDAVPGTDYAGLPGYATIQAGNTRKLIKIKPLGNLGGASSKNVILHLEPGKDYSVGTNMAVKVKILATQ